MTAMRSMREEAEEASDSGHAEVEKKRQSGFEDTFFSAAADGVEGKASRIAILGYQAGLIILEI